MRVDIRFDANIWLKSLPSFWTNKRSEMVWFNKITEVFWWTASRMSWWDISPVMYKSAWTFFRTVLREPAHKATVLMFDVGWWPRPIAIWTCFRSNRFCTCSIKYSKCKASSYWINRPEPRFCGFDGCGIIGLTVYPRCPTLMRLHISSLTPFSTTCQAVCGEYKAILFSMHREMMRSLQLLFGKFIC